MAIRTSPIQGVNVIIAVGSVDGMAGAAACMRLLKKPDVALIFTQASQVDQIDISEWSSHRRVGLIDLGVNNEGMSPNPQKTIDFVKKIYQQGHTIQFIADEHGKKAWKEVLDKCEVDSSKFTIKPKDREKYGSSCDILMKALDNFADSHAKELLKAGAQADRMNFNTPLGEVFNNCIKSDMSDPVRRPYVVYYMAFHPTPNKPTPDEKIRGWMNEYAEIEVNNSKILGLGKDLGHGIMFYDCSVGPYDPSSIFNEAYRTHSIVVLQNTSIFLGGEKQSGASIATNQKNVNILEIIQKAGITAGGMAAKANFALEDLQAVIEAVSKQVTT